MVWEKELNDRKRAILKSIIDDYIQFAQPVGSRTIARKHELGLGSATIRNEMADLEELGFITQPHTSAGRIPSDKGYRFYVDHLMQIQTLAQDEINKIKKAMDDRIEELNQLIRRASTIISTITGYTSVIMTPQMARAIIKSIQLVTVDEKRILVVVVAGGGIVHNKLIKHDCILNESHISRMSAALNQLMAGRTVDQVTMPMVVELQQELQLPSEVVFPILEAVEECVRKIETTDVYLDGMTNILNYPEFSDLFKAREVLDLLKEEEVITALVRA
ncbi:MAG: heat-inducible transcriptional repressor HrcA, partial [Clostridia bacterium]|nr:heat-inducible transcriptional repressor HrcA [Clostridia bacterium]